LKLELIEGRGKSINHRTLGTGRAVASPCPGGRTPPPLSEKYPLPPDEIRPLALKIVIKRKNTKN